jgi:lipopolysaccharide biosynthesis regulator YciM
MPRAAQLPAQYPSLDLLNALFTCVLEQRRPDAAATLIKDELARNPTLIGLDRLLEAQLIAAPPTARTTSSSSRDWSASTSSGSACTCEQCVLRAKQYYWRCPAARKWEDYVAATHRDAGRFT